MCGIAGFLNTRAAVSLADASEISAAMNRSLQHRGPDDDGVWIDAEVGVSLVHRRLSIVDLSPAGHQPMVSADGRFVINGEVYSFPEIRKDFELSEQRLREAGLLDASLVRRHWQEHLSGDRNWQYLIWDVLMLEAWRERWDTAQPAIRTDPISANALARYGSAMH
jgi:asparagine synthetase B (glutamine-hydrolysing)